MSASANPTLPRRSFLGWTAALAGCALLTRPALAVLLPGFIRLPSGAVINVLDVTGWQQSHGISGPLNETTIWLRNGTTVYCGCHPTQFEEMMLRAGTGQMSE